MNEPLLSFIIATRNRRDILLDTVRRLQHCGLAPNEFEVIVVDNASTDATAHALFQRFPWVRVVALTRNLGSCAKAVGIERACGSLLMLLDDDSFPRKRSIPTMLDHFARRPDLAAAAFMVHLPDGEAECSALPHVFVGCGVGLRADAVRAVGGLDRTWFMQAEEYDLSFRLLNAGWRVETFADLHVEHLKTPRSRVAARTCFYDARNNLLLVERYLPEPYRTVYRADWSLRYRALAAVNGNRLSYWRALASVAVTRRSQRARYSEHRLREPTLQLVFQWDTIQDRMAELKSVGTDRVVLAGWGKNVYPFVHAARQCGISILAIADDRFSDALGRLDRKGAIYRDLPVLPVEGALRLSPEAVVISDTSYVQAERMHRRLAERTEAPIHRWFGRPHQGSAERFRSRFPTEPADSHVSGTSGPVAGAGSLAVEKGESR